MSNENIIRKLLSGVDEAINELTDALQKAMEHAGPYDLPAEPGWSWYDALVKHAPEKAQKLKAPEQVQWERYLEAALTKRLVPPECFHLPIGRELIVSLTDKARVLLCDDDEEGMGYEIWIQMNEGGPTKEYRFIVVLTGDEPEGCELVQTIPRANGIQFHIYKGLVKN